MANPILQQRLTGIQAGLMAAYATGGGMSSSTRGSERESFIDKFLSQVLPSTFRFGTGDITDVPGNRSGQLDVVIEYPFRPSLPGVGTSPRLYLAEGVAAAIEVKSDLAKQWSEVQRTSTKLQALTRNLRSSRVEGPITRIPLIAVGYTGWKQMATLQQYLDSGVVDGALVIEDGLWAASNVLPVRQAQGAWSLWGLICTLDYFVHLVPWDISDPGLYAI